MNKFEFENLDPAGTIDLDEINNIAFVGGYQDIEYKGVSAVSVTLASATAVTMLFTCSVACNCNC